MVTIEHKISSNDEYQYKDHTILQRAELILEAVKKHDGQSKQMEQGNKRPISDGSYRLRNIQTMTPEGRRDYAKRLDVLYKEQSAQGSTLPQRVEVMKLKIEMDMLQKIISEDERRYTAASPVPVDVHHVQDQEMDKEAQYSSAHFVRDVQGKGANMQGTLTSEAEHPPIHGSNPQNAIMPVPIQHAHQQLHYWHQDDMVPCLSPVLEGCTEPDDSFNQPTQDQAAGSTATSEQPSSGPRQQLRTFFDELKILTSKNEVRHSRHESPCQEPWDFPNYSSSSRDNTPPTHRPNYHNPGDTDASEPYYMEQLRRLEHSNKQRLLQARQQQEAMMLSSDARKYPADNNLSATSVDLIQGSNLSHVQASIYPAQAYPIQDFQWSSSLREDIASPGTIADCGSKPTITHTEPQKLQDYQHQLLLLEQQNKTRRMHCREEQDTAANPGPKLTSAPSETHKLSEYQIQLILLEQQSKKRLMMARQEKEILQQALRSPDPSIAAYNATLRMKE